MAAGTEESVLEKLAEINGAMGMVKAWGVGIAAIVSAIGIAGLIRIDSVLDRITTLETEIKHIERPETNLTDADLAKIRAMLNEALAVDAGAPQPESPGGLERGAKPKTPGGLDRGANP